MCGQLTCDLHAQIKYNARICNNCLVQSEKKVDDKDHIHKICIHKYLQHKLQLYVLDRVNWQSRAEAAFKKHGPGVLVFDASEKRTDGQVNLEYEHGSSILDCFPAGFDPNKTWAIRYVYHDDLLNKPYAMICYVLKENV